MRFLMATISTLLVSLPAGAESLDCSIYQLFGTNRVLVAKDNLYYTQHDIDVTQWGEVDGHATWRKSLRLKEGFGVGILVVRDPELRGFGLWVKNDLYPEGFSWEWFKLEDADIYKKLQGDGRVRVRQIEHEDGIEIASVEFLTDIALRFEYDMGLGVGKKTHEVVVSKGSVLNFAP